MIVTVVIRECIERVVMHLLGPNEKMPIFTVEHPADETKGDYSSNIAMVMGGNPRENAEKIVGDLKKDRELGEVVDLEKICVAGPGFINFFLNDKYISSRLKLDDHFGESEWMKGKKVLVEYSSPNIAKRFSVGHFRSSLIGNAIYNLYKHSGARVTDDNHLGDWGTQFGMIIAAVKEWGFDWSVEKPVEKLEDLYVRYNKEIVNKPEFLDRAREEFSNLENGDEEARGIWQKSVEVSMKEFSEIYKKLDISFEHQNGESIYEKMMPAIIEECKDKKVAIEGEGGALIVPFEKDGKEYYPPAMLLKSDGSTTYFTRDLATVRKRLDDEDLKSDLYIYEVGSEQTMHFRQVFETVEKLGWATKNKFKHVQHGLLTLPEGKMSTRKGNTIKLEDLLGRAEEKSPELAISSVKYNELKRSPVMNYVFNWEEALSMEGNSAPYINYAYVRANKILQGKEISPKNMIFVGEEKDLARFLLRFILGEEVENAARNFAPQVMCAYIYELSKRFNGFYERNKVLGDPREEQRLALVLMVREVIKRGFQTLGIKVVEAM